MIPAVRPSLRRTFPALLLAAFLVAVAVIGGSSPAAAHDELVSSDPVAGAVLDALPQQLTLTFSAELLAGGGNEMQVTDATGTSLADGAAVVVDGNELVQPLMGDPAGAVTVLWRVVSSDGHPISGEFSFSVTPPAPVTTPEPTPASSPAVTPTATPTPTTTAAAEPAASASAAPVPASDGLIAVPWVILGVVLALAAGATVYLLVSRRRRRSGHGSGADPGR